MLCFCDVYSYLWFFSRMFVPLNITVEGQQQFKFNDCLYKKLLTLQEFASFYVYITKLLKGTKFILNY